MNKPKLKLGILLDSMMLPAWAFHSLERIVNLDSAIVTIIILNDSKKDFLHFEPDLLYKNNHNFVYKLFSNLDKAIFGRGPDAFAPRNAQELFKNVPMISVKPVNTSGSGCLAPSDTMQIKSYDLDILIKLGFDNLTGDILTAARFGVWSYYHGDHCRFRSTLPGFWEVVNRSPETGTILYALNEDSTIGDILYKSSVQTYPLSPTRNRNRCFWESSAFLPRQINLLYQLGEKEFLTEIGKYNKDIDSYNPKEYSTPSNLKTLWLFTKLSARGIGEMLQRATHFFHWKLLFEINTTPSFSFAKYQEIVPPRDRFWADPHIIQTAGEFFIFVEEFVYKKGKGHISVIEMKPNGEYKKPVQILSKKHHMSYPFVFASNGHYYMVPETSENKTIELYECTSFPFEWKFVMNLMENVIAVDSTIFFYKEKWWLFTGIAENEGALPEVELFLFYSNELVTKDWTPHLLNPIVSDVKKARPAGKIINDGEKIFRLSQDCSKNYGWGFNFSEILLLSEINYLEKDVMAVRPYWDKNIESVHTFSQSGPLTVIDVCLKKRKPF